jgi:hypothetical protein
MRIDVPTHVVARRSPDCGEALPLRKNGARSQIGENPISGDRRELPRAPFAAEAGVQLTGHH